MQMIATLAKLLMLMLMLMLMLLMLSLALSPYPPNLSPVHITHPLKVAAAAVIRLAAETIAIQELIRPTTDEEEEDDTSAHIYTHPTTIESSSSSSKAQSSGAKMKLNELLLPPINR